MLLALILYYIIKPHKCLFKKRVNRLREGPISALLRNNFDNAYEVIARLKTNPLRTGDNADTDIQELKLSTITHLVHGIKISYRLRSVQSSKLYLTTLNIINTVQYAISNLVEETRKFETEEVKYFA